MTSWLQHNPSPQLLSCNLVSRALDWKSLLAFHNSHNGIASSLVAVASSLLLTLPLRTARLPANPNREFIIIIIFQLPTTHPPNPLQVEITSRIVAFLESFTCAQGFEARIITELLEQSSKSSENRTSPAVRSVIH